MEFYAAHPHELAPGDRLSEDRMWLQEIDSVLNWCTPEKAGVDIGAGGRSLWPSVTRVDCNPQNSPDVTCDITRGPIPFGDEAFEWLYCGHALEHVQDTWAALSEFLRVIRPGGHVCLVIPNTAFTFGQNTDATPHRHEWTPREFCVEVLGWKPQQDEPWLDCKVASDGWECVSVHEACPGWSFAVILRKPEVSEVAAS